MCELYAECVFRNLEVFEKYEENYVQEKESRIAWNKDDKHENGEKVVELRNRGGYDMDILAA